MMATRETQRHGAQDEEEEVVLINYVSSYLFAVRPGTCSHEANDALGQAI